MGAILTVLASVLSGLAKPITDYFSYKMKKTEGEREIELAKIASEKEAIVSGNEAATQQMTARLKATGEWFKFITFVLINYPVVMTIYDPAQGQEIFKAIGTIPEWYAMLYVAIYGTIWGLPIAVNWMGRVYDRMEMFWYARQDKKIERIKVYNDKAYFDTMKEIFKHGMTQEQVDIMNKALDKYKGE